MVVQYVLTGIAGRQALDEACSELLAPLYLNGEAHFGLGASERWNFAVYLYSQQRDLLVPVWREKSPTHPSTGIGREWGRGQGHIGKAFVDGQPIITGDATNPVVAPLSTAPPALRHSYDETVYRSFASFPIGPVGNENPPPLPYGVLVATSDRAGRFDKENTLVLAHLADVIASVVVLANINVDELPTVDSNSSSDLPSGGQNGAA